MTTKAIESLTKEEIEAELAQVGEPSYRAKQLLEWLYLRRVHSFEEMSNLPQKLRSSLAERFHFTKLEVVREQGSEDTTRKFLFRLPDEQFIETVLIPASPALYGEPSDRRTLCVSSQVGCAYGCKFCASGLDGWKRNLNAGEIVRQLLEVERASSEKVNNIVFMGMGEPLANYDQLMRAITIINAPWGIGIGARHITVSTSGLVPQIRKLALEPFQIRLAISLHGATDEVRNKIMPVNRKYPLADLMEACEFFGRRRKQLITFEYILIEGINDSDDQARQLGKLSAGLKAKINLIPYNKVEGLHWSRPTIDRQKGFLETLNKTGATATLRREKGHDIAAACGQLRLQTERDLRASNNSF